MSGRNIFLVLVAVLAAVGLYVLVLDPGEVPAVAVETPSIVAPRMAPSSAPTAAPSTEPAPVLDDVANDAAADVEKLKKEQDEMNATPTPQDASPPEMSR